MRNTGIRIAGSKSGNRALSSGFTLVEVIVAAALGAIIFAALYCGIANSSNMVQTSRANLRATQIMVSQLEGMRLCAWGSGTNLSQLFNTSILPTTFTNYFYPVGLSSSTNGSTNLGTVFYGAMSIVQLTNAVEQTNIFGSSIPDYATNMAVATVSVSWTDGLYGHQVLHTRHMTTFVSAYGIQNYVTQH